MKKRRNEFMNYCLKKIHSAIHDLPMDLRDEQKSPLNVQKKAARLRREKIQTFRDKLRFKYGVNGQ